MTDAKPDSQAHRDYQESRILSASPAEIVHMLYQVAIDNLNIAKACLKSGDNFARSRAVTKAQTAVYELLAALDPAVNASMCRNLAELYDYVLRQIIAGHTRRTERSFDDALRVLTTLSEGWAGVKANVLGHNQAAISESEAEQSEAAPVSEISHLYLESPAALAATQDWSC